MLVADGGRGGAGTERDGIVQDHYSTLGVSRDADLDEIKRRFRLLAWSYHPDSNPHDPFAAARFAEASRAYEVLADSEARAAYDRRRTFTTPAGPAQGWYWDPYDRHDYRWFSQGIATSLVRDDDVTSYDDPPDIEVEDELEEVEDVPSPFETMRVGDATGPEMDGSGGR